MADLCMDVLHSDSLNTTTTTAAAAAVAVAALGFRET